MDIKNVLRQLGVIIVCSFFFVENGSCATLEQKQELKKIVSSATKEPNQHVQHNPDTLYKIKITGEPVSSATKISNKRLQQLLDEENPNHIQKAELIALSYYAKKSMIRTIVLDTIFRNALQASYLFLKNTAFALTPS